MIELGLVLRPKKAVDSGIHVDGCGNIVEINVILACNVSWFLIWQFNWQSV